MTRTRFVRWGRYPFERSESEGTASRRGTLPFSSRPDRPEGRATYHSTPPCAFLPAPLTGEERRSIPVLQWEKMQPAHGVIPDFEQARASRDVCEKRHIGMLRTRHNPDRPGSLLHCVAVLRRIVTLHNPVPEPGRAVSTPPEAAFSIRYLQRWEGTKSRSSGCSVPEPGGGVVPDPDEMWTVEGL